MSSLRHYEISVYHRGHEGRVQVYLNVHHRLLFSYPDTNVPDEVLQDYDKLYEYTCELFSDTLDDMRIPYSEGGVV